MSSLRVVLELSRILAPLINKRWIKEQRSQPKRSCNLDQQHKTLDLLTFSLFSLFGSFDKTCENKTLVAHMREGVEPLNAEGYQHTIETFKKEPKFKMSDVSRSQRIEVLESSVGEMKAELPHTREQIEQMMGGMQHLLQVKSADGGQQEEKSGGSDKGDANDYSCGTGKAPREEEAASARVGATTAVAAGGRLSSHISKASDEPRPTDDTGHIPEVPAGMGPMINMQRGEARDEFIAGVAHDRGGVLSSVFQRQSHVVPPVLKGEK